MCRHLFINSGLPYSLLFVGGVILSYLIGVVLGSVAWAIQPREWKTRLSELKLELPDQSRPDSGISYMYDFIQHNDPPAGARLAKLRAERHMCCVFIIGFIILTVLHWDINWENRQYLRLLPTTSLFVFVIVAMWLFHRHIEHRSRVLMLNYWHMLNEEKKAQEVKVSKSEP